MTMVRTLSFVTVLASLSLVANATSSTGTIRGEAAPHEQIIVTGEKSGIVVGVMTDISGHFEIPGLPEGQYSVVRAQTPTTKAGAPVLAGRVTDVVLPKN